MDIKIYTRGFPEGWGYYRSAGYWIPVKIDPSLPHGFTALREYRGDTMLVYSRREALQVVQEHLQAAQLH